MGWTPRFPSDSPAARSIERCRGRAAAASGVRAGLGWGLWLFGTVAAALPQPTPPLLPHGEVFADVESALARISRSSEVLAVAVHPDGEIVASGSTEAQVRLWDVATRTELRRLQGHTASIRDLAFSPDGRTLASASDDRTVRLWEMATGRPVTLEGHAGAVDALAFSPDGKTVISGSADGTVRLWDVATGTKLRRIEAHITGVSTVAVSPDGRILASGSSDTFVKLWNASDGQPIHCLDGHSSGVNTVLFSPTGRILVSGSSDHTIRLWDTADGEMLESLEDSSRVNDAVFSPDGTVLATGSADGRLRLWDVAERRLRLFRQLEGHTSTVHTVAMSSDGKTLFSGSGDRTIRLWDLASGAERARLKGHSAAVKAVAFRGDGKLLVTGSADQTLRLWDVTAHAEIHRLAGHSAEINAVTFSPDGRFLASGSADRTVRLWDAAGGGELRRLDGHTAMVNAVAFAPDGRLLASGSADRSVRLWDPTAGNAERVFEDLPGLVYALTFSPDGRFLAAGLGDRTIRLWDLESGSERQPFEGHSDAVMALAVSPDGKVLASGSRDQTLRLWDLDGAEIRGFAALGSSVLAVAFSPDGKHLVAGFEDGTWRVWDLDSDTELQHLAGHDRSILAVAMNPDGSGFASASADRTLRLWTLDPGAARYRSSQVYLSGQRGTWVSCRPDVGRCLRHDDGTLLLQSDEAGLLHPVPPRPLEAPDLELDDVPAEIEVVDGSTTTVSLKVRNRGPSRAFWIAVRRVAPPEADSLVFHAPPARALLEPGETVELPCRVSVHTSYDDPMARSLPLDLEITSLGTSPTAMRPITVHGKTASLEWNRARRTGDGDLIISLANAGDQELAETTLTAEVTGLDTPLDWRRPETAAAGESFRVLLPLPEGFEPGHDTRITVEVRQLRAPIHRWSFHDRPVAAPTAVWAWTLVVSVILLLGLFSAAVFRHPLVVRLSTEPEALLGLAPAKLLQARRLLALTRRLDTILEVAHVRPAWLDSAVAFQNATDPAARCRILAERLGVPCEGDDTGALYLGTLELGRSFPLNLHQCLLALPSPALAPEDTRNALRARGETLDQVTLVLSRDSVHQEALHELAADLGNLWVAPAPPQVTQLFLAADPLAVLARRIAAQVPLVRVSPYQVVGGVDEPVFFGRRQFLAHILNRAPANYLLVGGRQLGKTSFLKAVERRYREHPHVYCHYLALAGDDLAGPLALSLGLPPGSGLDETFARLRQDAGEGSRLILVDEVDAFIRAERRRGYETLGRLRSLSLGTKAHVHFILAGFWELYETVLDYQSPLMNFAEILTIGALETDACEDLCTRPMSVLGLSWESPALVERLVERTGGRPNLISAVCNEVVRNLGAHERVIRGDTAERALESDVVDQALSGWRSLVVDDVGSRLDRMVVYATIEEDSFTLAELLEKLDALGESVGTERLRRSLSRLELAFVLGGDGDRYRYRVPLFREKVLALDPALLLARELGGAEKNPLVTRLLVRPRELKKLSSENLHRLSAALDRSLLEDLLDRAGVQGSWFDSAVALTTAADPADRCRLLAERLNLQWRGPHGENALLWTLRLGPEFPLNRTECLLALPPDEWTANDVLQALRAHPEAADQVTLILSGDGACQQEIHERVHESTDLWVAPSPVQLTGLLLASDPIEDLARLMASQVPRIRISPYPTGGGVDKETVFFGRRRLLADIMNRDPSNYLLVGGRQLGKSSLLKAIERRYRDHPRVLCHYLVLGSHSTDFTERELCDRLARIVDLPTGTGLETVLAGLAEEPGAGRRRLVLIDEADVFLRGERQRHYAVLGRLRSLSEEGRCHFILAGFWELYESAVLDYQSPLGNFGETLTVGALEPEACRQLCTRPMAAMGLAWDSPELVDHLVEVTGQRANLIAIGCNEILKNLDAKTRTLGTETVDRALRSEAVDNALATWKRLPRSDDPACGRLDRIVVYATIDRESFTQAELLDELEAMGESVAPEQLERSLARLELAFVLRREDTVYSYRVPLLVDRLRAKRPQDLLRHELRHAEGATGKPGGRS